MRLVRLEILRLLREPRVTTAMGAFSTVLVLAGMVSWDGVRQDTRIKSAVAAEERQRWLGQGEKDPHTAAHYSVYVFKPAAALQTIDPGIFPFVGEAVWLEAHVQNDLLFRPQQDAHSFERLGLVDPASLLIRFGPLVVFLLAFAGAARERAQGVLGLALGTALKPGAYLGAKVVSVIGVVTVTLVLPVTLMGVFAISSGTALADEALRLAGWTTAAVVYVAVLSVAAVCICLLTRSVQTAFGGLLLVWVTLVLAALPAASAWAEWWNPIPSFQGMKRVLAEEAPAYWTPETGAEQIASILRGYGAAREEDLGQAVNIRGAQLDLAERRAQAVFDREIGGFYDRIQAQDQTYAHLGWLSPAVAFDVVSAAFAGTDFFHHRHFIDSAERYRRALVNRMNADLIPHPAIEGREHTNDVDLWSEVLPFEYGPLTVSSAARSAMPTLVALVCWLLGGIVLVRVIAVYVRP